VEAALVERGVTRCPHLVGHHPRRALAVGLATFHHHVILQSKHLVMTAPGQPGGVHVTKPCTNPVHVTYQVHVTNLTPPGSD
jgi:hypothetical protein